MLDLLKIFWMEFSILWVLVGFFRKVSEIREVCTYEVVLNLASLRLNLVA